VRPPIDRSSPPPATKPSCISKTLTTLFRVPSVRVATDTKTSAAAVGGWGEDREQEVERALTIWRQTTVVMAQAVGSEEQLRVLDVRLWGGSMRSRQQRVVCGDRDRCLSWCLFVIALTECQAQHQAMTGGARWRQQARSLPDPPAPFASRDG
jgi:hypothetical protein